MKTWRRRFKDLEWQKNLIWPLSNHVLDAWNQTWIYPLVSDAEPKYLVAVQPIPVNDVKKHCTGTPTTSCLVSTAVHADRMSHSVLTSVHRKGEPGEASSPGDRLCQPDGGAAVLGKLPEDALRWEHHERVSGGWVRAVVLLFTSLIHQHRLQLSLLLLLSVNHLHMLRDTLTLFSISFLLSPINPFPPPSQVGEAIGKLEPGILCHSGRLIKS